MTIRFKKLTITLGMLLISSSVLIHGHHFRGAPISKTEQKASEGIFDDNQVQDRTLTGWDGMWQSAYPHLVGDEPDPVFKKEAEKDESKTAEQIKTHYRTDCTTSVNTIDIENDAIKSHTGNQVVSCKYDYAGYKVLNYGLDKKGVRYLFGCKTTDSKAPRYVQFNGHIIAPCKSSHFHTSMGSTLQAALSEEIGSWPTYYPHQLRGEEVVDEMLHY